MPKNTPSLVLFPGALGVAVALCLAASSGLAPALPSTAPEKTSAGLSQESQMNTDSSNILFCVGDSIVEGLSLHEVAGFAVSNAGIGGAGVRAFLSRAGDILPHAQGTTVLLAVGVNDVNRGHTFSAKVWEAEYRKLCAQLAAVAARFIVQTVLPVEKRQPWGDRLFPAERIAMMNDIIRNIAKKQGYCLIDMYARFADPKGFMPAGATTDGVHLTGASYVAWREYWEKQLPRCREGK